jgi:large subunit ribosomal protein L25
MKTHDACRRYRSYGEKPGHDAADLGIRVPSPGSGPLSHDLEGPRLAMETKLTAERRSDAGKGVARKLRAAGKVPAVLYGQGLETTPLTVDGRELGHLLHGSAGSNVLVDLVVDGEAHLAIPREIQRDRIHAKFVHVDFLAVSRTETITVNVPVHETGEAAGVKEGGVVEHHLREVQIECLPQNVPDEIVIDITHVELGDMIHVSDLAAPTGVTILSNPEDAVLSVVTPAALRVEADLSVPGEEGVEAPAAEAEGEEAAEAAEGETAEGEGDGDGKAESQGGDQGSDAGEGGGG